VLQNIDDLFERDELSAAPDTGWPDYFNTGVLVYRPSLQTFEELCALTIKPDVMEGRNFFQTNSDLINPEKVVQ